MAQTDELNFLYEQINQAVSPEDIFGQFAPGKINQEKEDEIKKTFRRLAKIVHPDRFGPDLNEVATETFAKLNQFYERALEKIKNGKYGEHSTKSDQRTESSFIIQTAKRSYRINRTVAQGDLATVYGGVCDDDNDQNGQVIVKVVDDPTDNEMLRNEIRVIKILQAEPSNQSKHLPMLLDQFKTTDGQLGAIFRFFDGYDFPALREKCPNGVPAYPAAWILSRTLSVIGYAHFKGVLHNNIEPAHFLVRPRDHNLCLIDWSYAIVNPAKSGERFRVFNEDYSAPEIRERKVPLPSVDLYSIGKCLIYLLGGDIKTDKMPDSVPEKFQRFIKFFVLKSQLGRAQDAWEMYETLEELRKEIWGRKKFVEFAI